jgi:hypothetical protein
MAYFQLADDYSQNIDPEKSDIIGLRLRRELELNETFSEYEDIPVIYHGIVEEQHAMSLIESFKNGYERVALPSKRYGNCVYPQIMDNFYAYIPEKGIHFFVLYRN